MTDLIGQTLDRYEIIELIGEGGMATVYRARQPRLQRDVAVKVMLPTLATDPIFRERFEREAQAIANLRHPNILTVYDYGETDDGQLYLVVDYVPGGTLRERLERPMPLEEAIEIIAQVAEALDYAHRQEVIHRDVKPNNILLTGEGHPLLADFGLVKPIRGERRLTDTGVMLGTPDYMAPEQAQGLAMDGRTDVYALGVILFELLTGQHPYAGETPMSVIIKHISAPMPRPSELNPALPAALDEIITKATAKSPDERYQRAGEMARALRTVLVSGTMPAADVEGVTPPLTPPVATPPETPAPDSPVAMPTPTPVSRPWYQQVWVWAGVGVILALAVAAVLILPSALSREGEEAPLGAVPTAQPGETMILIAQFKAQAGSERYDVSQRIYDKLSADLRQLGETDVSVYQVPDVVESPEAAVALGQRYGATTVIWGYYDDIGISPSVEAVGLMEGSPLSVGLERFNLNPEDAVNFKLYIAKDLPEELSFLTAISLSQAFMVQGRFEKAISYMLLAADNLPEDPQFRGGGEMVFFMQAMMAVFQGDVQGALAHIDQAIAINPNKALFYSLRAALFATTGDLDKALADVEHALTLDPKDFTAHGTKAYVHWTLGELEAALDAYDQLLQLSPDEPMGYVGRGIISFEMDDLAQAHAAWDRAEALQPDAPLVWVARGLAYEKTGQADQAAAEYARSGDGAAGSDTLSQFVRFITNPKDATAPAYFYLVECVMDDVQGKSEQALERCTKALEVDPARADALWKRGQIYAAQGELEAAVADYTAAIQADPSWPWFYYLRAQALAELGRSDEAQADLARALELNPVDELRQQIEDLDVEQ